MIERSRQNCCHSPFQKVTTMIMTLVIPSGIYLVCFFLILVQAKASHTPNNPLSQSTENALNRMNIPTHIRSGVGTVVDQKFAIEEREHRDHLAFKRAIANEAVAHAETAQLVFAFKHNYLVPQAVEDMLPADFRKKIPDIDLKGQKLTLSLSSFETKHLLRAISYVNGYGLDLEEATEHADMKLIRMINESGLNPELSPIAQAKVFFRLSLNLSNHQEYGMTMEEANHLKAELMEHASKKVSGQMNDYSLIFSEDIQNDAVLSTSQFLYWASLKEPKSEKKLALAVDALHSLKAFNVDGASQKWGLVFNDLLEKTLHQYQSALIILKPDLDPNAVNHFIEYLLGTYSLY